MSELSVVRCRNCGEFGESFAAIFMCLSCRIEICDKCKARHMEDFRLARMSTTETKG